MTAVVEDAGLTLTEGLSATSVTVSEGGSTTVTYTVVLDSMPTGMVGIGIGNPSTGTHDPNLSVTVPDIAEFRHDELECAEDGVGVDVAAAADDDTVNGTAEFESVHTASGGYSAVATLTATEADDDTVRLPVYAGLGDDVAGGSRGRTVVGSVTYGVIAF